MPSWKLVAQVDDIFGDVPCPASLNGTPIALIQVDGQIHAIEDRCPHDKTARLSDGYVDGHTIECPMHQSCFDIRTGKVLSPPATSDVKCFATRVEDGAVYVEVEGD